MDVSNVDKVETLMGEIEVLSAYAEHQCSTVALSDCNIDTFWTNAQVTIITYCLIVMFQQV